MREYDPILKSSLITLYQSLLNEKKAEELPKDRQALDHNLKDRALTKLLLGEPYNGGIYGT